MSKVSLLYLIVLNSIIFVNGETCSGTVEPSANLVEEEKCSEYVKEAADFATLEIHKQKLRNGEYDQCTTLENKVINGKKQVGHELFLCFFFSRC